MLEEKLGTQAGVHLIEGVRLIWSLLMFHWNETCFTVHYVTFYQTQWQICMTAIWEQPEVCLRKSVMTEVIV